MFSLWNIEHLQAVAPCALFSYHLINRDLNSITLDHFHYLLCKIFLVSLASLYLKKITGIGKH